MNDAIRVRIYIYALLMMCMCFYLLAPNKVLFNYDGKVATILFFIIVMYYGIKLAFYIKINPNFNIKREKNKIIGIVIKCVCWLLIIILIYFSVLRNLMFCNLDLLNGLSKIYN